MEQQNKKQILVSRRKFIGTTAVAATALSVLPITRGCTGTSTSPTNGGAGNQPDSKFGGVQIGAITYSWRDKPSGAADILKYCKEAGVSSIELMGDVVEAYAGLPPTPTELPEQLTDRQKAGLEEIFKMTNTTTIDQLKKIIEPNIWPMIVAGVIGTTEEQTNWRLSVPMTKFEELRKMYNDAGVGIHITKLQPSGLTDGEIDYAFNVAKALGAKGISDETGMETAKRLGPFAEKHGMYAILHNHFQFAEKNFNVDDVLAVSPAVMLNFDCGHYYGSTGLDPAAFIEKYHNRIFSLHLKDKTGPDTNPPNENQVWGQGEVPLEEVLLLLRKHAAEDGWPKYADIELEYPVAAWSDSVKEVKTCVAYARQILI